MSHDHKSDRRTFGRRGKLVRAITADRKAIDAGHRLMRSESAERERDVGSGREDTFTGEPPASLAAAIGGRRSFALGLAGVGLAWLALRAFYFTGYYAEDAPGYVTDAIQCVLGTYHARNHVLGLNVGTYFPVALPLALLGKTEVALGLWPLLCSLLALVSLTGTATLLFGRPYGLLAALLYATYPGDVFYSTVVMPDAIQAGWLAGSLFLVVSAFAAPGAPRWWRLAAGGLAMGVCHLVRANGALLLPIGVAGVVALTWQWRHESFSGAARALAAYLAGWVIVPVLEGLVYSWAVGDFLHRFHVVDRHYGAIDSIGRWGLNTDWSTIPFSIFPPLQWWRSGGWGRFEQDQAYHAFIFCLAVAAIVLAGVALASARRQRGADRLVAGFTLGLFWLAWPLLAHEFGSQSLTHFVPMHRLSRHLVVYAPGAVFATVAGCAVVVRAAAGWRPAARRSLAAAGLFVLALHVSFNWQAERVAHGTFERIKETYVRIRERLPAGVHTIVADPGDLGFFDFWLNPLGGERVQLIPFAQYSHCEDLPHGVVLTWSNPGWADRAPVIQETVRRLPCLTQPPRNWQLLYGGFPEKVYVVVPAVSLEAPEPGRAPSPAGCPEPTRSWPSTTRCHGTCGFASSISRSQRRLVRDRSHSAQSQPPRFEG